MIAELLARDIACQDQVPKAHETFVIAVFFVITDAAPLLPGDKGTAVDCPGRDADHAVKLHFMLQKHIQNAGCINPPHAAAL